MNQKLPYNGENLGKLTSIQTALKTLRKDYDYKGRVCFSTGDIDGAAVCADISYFIDRVQGHIAAAHTSKSQKKFDLAVEDASHSYDELLAHIKVNGKINPK